ncbi:LptF/LptG family permease [Dokdonia sp. Asnod1-B02]|uniref:LptF/LptG family permease n=1 Tax=Dokdonia sp. Asnod1-B02 TaxID=3160573 RepID=UPI003862F420
MKILDRYILFTFVRTFLSIFTILMFIFVLQSVWLYIQELAGRDLDFDVIIKFLLFAMPSLVTLVLPLSVLLTSIMTFGNFAENYEFAAMKSTGISLQRAMKSVIYFVIFLAISSFLFANHVIPASQIEFRNLRRNIGKLKPAMLIRSGQFNEITEDFNMRVAEKYGDRDQYLRDIVIHQAEKGRLGNYTVIIASEGELISSIDSPTLSLKLTDGNYYTEVQKKDYKERKKEPFAKSYFETYTLNIDLSELDAVDLDDKDINNSYQMMNIVLLDSSIIELSKRYVEDRTTFSDKYIHKANLTSLDSLYSGVTAQDKVVKDTLLENYEVKDRVRILEIAKSNLNNTVADLENRKNKLKVDVKRLSKFEISLHEKYVLGFSCILLFFVGAPLGAIIRKGGLGLPIVIGVVLFLTFHFIGIFAKNSSENNSISPFFASWLSTFILLPLGVYLTYRATTDQGIFDVDIIPKPIKRLFAKKKEETIITPTVDKSYVLTEDEIQLLDSFSSNQLKDVVKNYKDLGYSNDMRLAAIDRLDQLGITIEHLRVQGYYQDSK